MMQKDLRTKPSAIEFEAHYSDGSGVEYAVRYDGCRADYHGERGLIEFEHVSDVTFPASRLGWLIECLTYIRDHRADTEGRL
jgi:hypothetical protein